MAIDWTKERVECLKDLVVDGFTSPEIAEILSIEFGANIDVACVNNARNRKGITSFMLNAENDVQIYDEELRLPMDNMMIFCDRHSPYQSIQYTNRAMWLADKYKIKTAVEVGDIFDMDFAKWSKMKQSKGEAEVESSLDKERILVKATIDSMTYFDSIVAVLGNHESRVERMTDGRIQARHIIELLGNDDFNSKFKLSIYDKLFIGDDYMVVHPRSYSQISGNVAVRLAEKFHKNVLNAHGHFASIRYDRSGEFMAVDLGGLFDARKIEYINKKTTTHPSWNNGFGMLLDGEFHHFHPKTPWGFWGFRPGAVHD